MHKTRQKSPVKMLTMTKCSDCDFRTENTTIIKEEMYRVLLAQTRHPLVKCVQVFGTSVQSTSSTWNITSIAASNRLPSPLGDEDLIQCFLGHNSIHPGRRPFSRFFSYPARVTDKLTDEPSIAIIRISCIRQYQCDLKWHTGPVTERQCNPGSLSGQK